MTDISEFVRICEESLSHQNETTTEACERLATWASRCFDFVTQVEGDDSLAEVFLPRGRKRQTERDPFATSTGLFHGDGCSEGTIAMIEQQLDRKIPGAMRQLLLTYRWVSIGSVADDVTIDLDALVELDSMLKDMAEQLELPQLHDRYLLFAGDLEAGVAFDLRSAAQHDPPVCPFFQDLIAENSAQCAESRSESRARRVREDNLEADDLLGQSAASFSAWVSQTVDRTIHRMKPAT